MKTTIKNIGLALLALAVVIVMIILLIRQSDATFSTKQNVGDVAVEYLNGQMTQAAYTPTIGTPPLSAAEIAATAMVFDQHFQATQDAENRLAEQHAQETAQTRADAEESAQATSTAEWAAIFWSATSTAAYEQTQTAIPPTQTAAVKTETAYPLVATTDAQRLIAQQQLIQAQTDNLSRKVAQEKWTSPLWNILSPIIVGVGLFLVWLYIKEMKRIRKLTPDGEVNAIEDEKGHFHVTNAKNMTGPSLKIHSTGVKAEGETPYQEKITTQAQKVQAVAAAAQAQYPQQAFNVATDIMTGQELRYDISAGSGDGIDPETGKTLDLAWENKK